MSDARRTAALRSDAHRVAALGAASARDVGFVNPQVAGLDALFAPPADLDGGQIQFVVQARPRSMFSSRAMRSSVGGCVENRRASDSPLKGWMMYMCDMDGETSIGMRFE